MRRSREEAAETRRKLLAAAAELFRARGIDEVSVADVTSAVGLTVGGFYRHFASKDELVAEAIELASLETTALHARTAPGAADAERASALLDSYLSAYHRDHPERGCPVAALCSEIAHQSSSTRQAFTEALQRLLAVVGEVVPGKSKRVHEQRLQLAASLVGALVLSRASAEPRLAAELLAAARKGAASLVRSDA
jgi:TetR/AcrR family transcriptional repressor of nem operon